MESKSQSFKMLAVFLIVVLIGVIISITYKSVSLFSKSIFSNKTISVILLDKDARIVNLDKNKISVDIIYLPDAGKNYKKESSMTTSVKLGVPIEGKIIAKNPGEFEKFNTDLVSFSQVAKGFLGGEYEYKNMNAADLLKIYLFLKKVPSEDIDLVKVKAGEVSSLDTEDMFIDSDIFNQKVSLEVVNAAGITGFGGKVSGFLKKLGYNVVSIKNGDEQKLEIRANDLESSSVKRLEQLFGVEARKNSSTAIADITLILGTDIYKTK